MSRKIISFLSSMIAVSFIGAGFAVSANYGECRNQCVNVPLETFYECIRDCMNKPNDPDVGSGCVNIVQEADYKKYMPTLFTKVKSTRNCYRHVCNKIKPKLEQFVRDGDKRRVAACKSGMIKIIRNKCQRLFRDYAAYYDRIKKEHPKYLQCRGTAHVDAKKELDEHRKDCANIKKIRKIRVSNR